MAFYDMPGLATYIQKETSTQMYTPYMKVLILGQRDYLSNKFQEQIFDKGSLELQFNKFYGRKKDLVKLYDVPLSPMSNDFLKFDHIH